MAQEAAENQNESKEIPAEVLAGVVAFNSG
jgi:hypothetical protein